MTITRFAGLLAVLLMLIPGMASGQSRHDVTGTVTDSTEVGLQGATVVLLTPSDSTLVKFGITNGDGEFNIRRVNEGAYILQVTFVGFTTQSRNVDVSGGPLDAGTIVLDERVSELDELVVSSEHIPILMRSDTLDYNAAAFGVRANATVEDLLRRLPGVEVESDGSIKAQGEAVQKVLVDGKEFFGNDPKIATQNLPAGAVDRVQVYDDKSDMAEFTGVDDGEREKTIDLKLKEDAKSGYFGNVGGGVGDTERYDIQASVNRFSPNTQFSLLANMNNVNRQSFSFNDYINFMGGIGNMMSGGRIEIGGGGMIGGGLSDGFSETRSIGLNFNRDFTERTSIRSSWFYNGLDNLQTRSLQQQQLLGADLSSLVSENGNQDTENWSHRGNLNLFHEMADGHDIRLRTSGSYSNSALISSRFRQTFSGAGVLANTGTTAYDSEGDTYSGNAQLTYRKRLNESGTSVVAEAKADVQDRSTLADLESLNAFYSDGNLSSEEEILQMQETLGDQMQLSQEVTLTQPLGGDRVLEVSAERRTVSNDEERSYYDLMGGLPQLNVDLSTGTDRTYTYTRGGSSVRQTGEGFTAGIGADVQRSSLTGSIRGVASEIDHGFTHVLPRADIRYDVRRGMTVSLRYNTSTREPSMRDLQPFTDNSDPLNVYVGNPDLVPEYRHQIGASMHFFDQFTFTNFFLFANATYTDNNITRSRTVDEQFRQVISSVNTGGDWTFNGNANFGTPIRPLGAKISLSNNAMYNQGLEIINGAENESRTLRNSSSIRLENRNKDLFDISARVQVDMNRSAYSLNPQLDQTYYNKTLGGNAALYVGESWEISTGINYRIYSKEVFGSSSNVALWEAKVTRYLMDQRMEVQLVGMDLLDQNQGVNYTNSGTFIREERIASLGRYMMFKLVYNLSPTRKGGGGAMMIH